MYTTATVGNPFLMEKITIILFFIITSQPYNANTIIINLISFFYFLHDSLFFYVAFNKGYIRAAIQLHINININKLTTSRYAKIALNNLLSIQT